MVPLRMMDPPSSLVSVAGRRVQRPVLQARDRRDSEESKDGAARRDAAGPVGWSRTGEDGSGSCQVSKNRTGVT